MTTRQEQIEALAKKSAASERRIAALERQEKLSPAIPTLHKLGQAITGGVTTNASLRYPPHSSIDDIGEWVVVDAYTTEAELAEIDSGGDVAPVGGGAFSNSHSAGDLIVPVPDKVLNVRLFGAVGDGATDDTDAIQATVDEAETVGGTTVLVPPGTYICTLDLSTGGGYSDITLQGAGRDLSILQVPNSTTDPLIDLTDTSDIHIRQLGFDGNEINQTYASVAQYLIYISGASVAQSGIVIEDCEFADMIAGALYAWAHADGLSGLHLTRCLFLDSNRSMVVLRKNIIHSSVTYCRFENHGDGTDSWKGIAITAGQDITIRSNNFYNANENGASILVEHDSASGAQSKNIFVEDNYITGNEYNSIKVAASYRVTISGNHIHANNPNKNAVASQAIYLSGAQDIKVSDNIIGNPDTESDGSGIYITDDADSLEDCEDVIINDNRIQNYADHGILWLRGQKFIVANNIISDCTRGVWIRETAGTTDYYVIRGNLLYTNSIDGIDDDGTGTNKDVGGNVGA